MTQPDPRTLTLVEVLAALWQDRRELHDKANDPSVTDAEIRALCRTIALPPTADDMAWAREVMDGGSDDAA